MIRAYEDVIIQTVTRLLTPFVQLFALYVIAHGHYSPGGGFQGGCIMAASFILMAVANDVSFVRKRLPERLNAVLISAGVLVYAGIGLACLFLGANFLDYGILHTVLPVGEIKVRALATLGVEIGVGITVTAVMVSIFLNLLTGEGNEVAE